MNMLELGNLYIKYYIHQSVLNLKNVFTFYSNLFFFSLKVSFLLMYTWLVITALED